MSVVVVGDALLDQDMDGAAHRLAPDAPVPVVSDVATRSRPGGAGLAAALLATDGIAVALVCALGRDHAGARLRRLLEDFGVEVHDVAERGTTARKVRVRAGGQCVTRIDFDGAPPTADPGRAAAAAEIVASAEAVLVADYGRGLAADPDLGRALASSVRQRRIVWDPHPRGPEPVPGVSLVTPNQREATVRAGRDTAAFPGEIAQIAFELRARWAAKAVAVTCGARGALLAQGDAVPLVVPVERAVAGDACGAGDRFASAALALLHSGALPSEAVRTAVAAATQFVDLRTLERLSRPDDAPPVREASLVATSGCFDLLHAGHVSMLRAARGLGDHLIVCLNSDESVRRLKGEGRPLVRAEDRAELLRSLACVDDVVVFGEDTPERVLARLRPDVFVKGGDYDAATLPEAAVMARWGGRTVVVPYLEGRSTTRILQEARDGAG
jgi:rfaE bifunctional protein nucleotidyltransferase chain/domain/rfaE bifunctional protein kinase chain/domain